MKKQLLFLTNFFGDHVFSSTNPKPPERFRFSPGIFSVVFEKSNKYYLQPAYCSAHSFKNNNMKNSLNFKFIGTFLMFLSFSLIGNFGLAQNVKPDNSRENVEIHSGFEMSNEMPVPVEKNSYRPVVIKRLQILSKEINALPRDQRELIIKQVDTWLQRESIDNSELNSVKSIVNGGKDLEKALSKYSYDELKNAFIALEKTYKLSFNK
jgi:hypothetical protein